MLWYTNQGKLLYKTSSHPLVLNYYLLENGTTRGRAGDVLGRRANARGWPGSYIQVYILGK